MREYLLLGDGEFFRTFIDGTDGLFRSFPPTTAEEDLNLNWKACSSIKSEAFERKEKKNYFLSINWVNLPSDDLLSKSLSWGNFVLEYFVPPPMNIFFTRENMDNYQRVFRLLFVLKRAETELNSIWTVISKRKFGNFQNCVPIIWQLRSQFLFFLSQFQSYLQAKSFLLSFPSLRCNRF